jgi:hypothetical protein
MNFHVVKILVVTYYSHTISYYNLKADISCAAGVDSDHYVYLLCLIRLYTGLFLVRNNLMNCISWSNCFYVKADPNLRINMSTCDIIHIQGVNSSMCFCSFETWN